jgi:serine/threonine-protein phosphatase 4 regulatory subunit 1
MKWKVRRALAYSLHQLAVILGDELTKTEILPVFEDFMHDVDEVRIALMKHMCEFLQVAQCHFYSIDSVQTFCVME